MTQPTRNVRPRRGTKRVERVAVLRHPAGSVVAIDLVQLPSGAYGIGFDYGDGIREPHEYDSLERARENAQIIVAKFRKRGDVDADESELPPPTPIPTHVRYVADLSLEPWLIKAGAKRECVGKWVRSRRGRHH